MSECSHARRSASPFSSSDARPRVSGVLPVQCTRLLSFPSLRYLTPTLPDRSLPRILGEGGFVSTHLIKCAFSALVQRLRPVEHAQVRLPLGLACLVWKPLELASH